jgi:site-specific recombinase XerD
MERSLYRDYLERFAAKLAAEGKARNTVACYTRDVGEFLGFLGDFGPERIDALTEEQVARFVGGLKVRELGERSKAKKLTSIRAFLSWAQVEGILITYPPKLTFAKVRGVLHAIIALEASAQQPAELPRKIAAA